MPQRTQARFRHSWGKLLQQKNGLREVRTAARQTMGGSPAFLRSKPQHCFGDYVALNLIGAAVNRHLAVVEVTGCGGCGPDQVFGWFVGAELVVVFIAAIGQRERTSNFEQ